MVEAKRIRPITKAARNERRKAAATTCNAISVALFVSRRSPTLLAGRFTLPGVLPVVTVVVVLQIVLHYILRQVED